MMMSDAYELNVKVEQKLVDVYSFTKKETEENG